MSDRLGTLLKEAADDSLGGIRIDSPDIAPALKSDIGRPVERRGRSGRMMTIATAAAVLVVVGTVLVLGLLRSSDADRPADQVDRPTLSQDRSVQIVAAAMQRWTTDEWIAETADWGLSPRVYRHLPPDPRTGRNRQLRLDVPGAPSSVIAGPELWVESLRGTWSRFAILPGARIDMPARVLLDAVVGGDDLLSDQYKADSARHLGGDRFAIAPADNSSCIANRDPGGPAPSCEIELEIRDGRVIGTSLLEETWPSSMSADVTARFDYSGSGQSEMLSDEESARLSDAVAPFPFPTPSESAGSRCRGQILLESDGHQTFPDVYAWSSFRFDVVVDPLADQEEWMASRPGVVAVERGSRGCHQLIPDMRITVSKYTDDFEGAPWLTPELLEFAKQAKKAHWGFED